MYNKQLDCISRAYILDGRSLSSIHYVFVYSPNRSVSVSVSCE